MAGDDGAALGSSSEEAATRGERIDDDIGRERDGGDCAGAGGALEGRADNSLIEGSSGEHRGMTVGPSSLPEGDGREERIGAPLERVRVGR